LSQGVSRFRAVVSLPLAGTGISWQRPLSFLRNMLFNSFHFVYFFLIVTTLFFVLPHNKRWMLLLAASCYFYMAFVPIYIVILGFTIVVDYFAGIYIEKAEGRRRRNYLIVSLVANIGVLCVFKYYNFFNENLSFLMKGFGLDNPIPYLSILLPIGLSFHTFQSLSYVIEVYWKKQKLKMITVPFHKS
jgi:D-alanyl-lipoteichoic acid acyltransferase DltB (MBOAT superfamily)